jgi:acetyltransferase-like isoleucine patch superfamily enzyme
LTAANGGAYVLLRQVIGASAQIGAGAVMTKERLR